MKKWVMISLVIVAHVLLATLTNLHKLKAHVPGTPTRVEDTDIYYRYAMMVWSGKVPYRDFLIEYPPLALPLFLAPRIFSASLAGYKLAFAVEMLLFNALTVWLVADRVEKREGIDRIRSRLAWYTLYFLLLSRFVVSRYDAAPMFLGFGAAVWWSSGRARFGGLSAALGTLTKFYPALVAVPACLVEILSRGDSRWRGSIVFGLTLTLGTVGWFAFDGIGGVARSVEYHAGRGFEYGSLYAGVQMLAAKLVGAEIVVARDHASYSSLTHWSPGLIGLVFPIQVASVLVVYWTFIRRGLKEAVRYSGAAILAFIVTGKVFSPQFLIWLMPFFAVLEGPGARRGRWLFAAGCVATLLAPSGTPYFPRTSLWIIIPYNIKNALFLWLLVLLTFGRPEGVPADGRRSQVAR